jgi:hypothetical protein
MTDTDLSEQIPRLPEPYCTLVRGTVAAAAVLLLLLSPALEWAYGRYIWLRGRLS